MADLTPPPANVLSQDLPDRRPCTRCDGEQVLLAGSHGMGKYECERCTMVVGFDLDADDVEFLIDRGSPSRYTKDVFGERLTAPERRLRAPVG